MGEKVLIVDDIASNRIITKARLSSAGYNPLAATSGKDCLRIAQTSRPAIILLDLMIADMPSIEIIQNLRQNPTTAHIPIIAIASTRADCTRALEARASDAILKPYSDRLLLARIRNLLRSYQTLLELTNATTALDFAGMAETVEEYTPPSTIAIISEHPESSLKLRHQLSTFLLDNIILLRPAELTSESEITHNADADIYIIETQNTKYEHSQRLLSDLRSRSSTRNAGICMLMNETTDDHSTMALDLGANEVICNEMDAKEISLRLGMILNRKRMIERAKSQLKDNLRLAMVDPLTGLFNRRYALRQLAHITEISRNSGKQFAVMIADIDHFKAINDQYGHGVGDRVLIETSQRLLSSLRQDDFIARIGGEEFLIVLPSTDINIAEKIAIRLCHQIEQTHMLNHNGLDVNATISIGVSVYHPQADNDIDITHDLSYGVIQRADRALLSSKAAGRNKVSVSLEHLHMY